jgi:hypothetical protein
MQGRDLDRERSEQMHTRASFLKIYNDGLPPQFPRASLALLSHYQAAYPGQFKAGGLWSLDVHRKKFMDWLPMHLKSLEP